MIDLELMVHTFLFRLHILVDSMLKLNYVHTVND